MKKFLIVLLAVLSIFTCTSCGAKEEPTPEPEPEEEVIVMPVKGETVKLGSNSFIVLTIDDTKALVLSMKNYGPQVSFDNNTYEDSRLDNLCTKYYDSLPDDIKNAIIETDIEINSYMLDFEENTENHTSDARYSSKELITTLKRKVYAPELADIEDYYSGTFTGKDIKNLFFTDMSCLWLRSAVTDYRDAIWGINGDSGTILCYSIENKMDFRPEFEIDLSLVEFEIIG